MVNNIPAAVYYVSPTQIDFQVPSGVSGSASVQVVVNGVASNSLSATASANSPGLFPNNVNGVNYPAAVFALSGGYPGDPTVPGYRAAAAFNQIELYATGLATEPGGVLPTAQAIDGVTVTIGNVTAPADYAGQTPYAGEFQINFTVPGAFATMPAGNYPISIAINGVSSPTTINSSPPGQIVLPITH
jgi:adhesin/invasin